MTLGPEWDGRLRIDLNHSDRTLSITIEPGTWMMYTAILEACIRVVRGADVVIVHRFPEHAINLWTLRDERTLTFEVPPLPHEDFEIAAALMHRVSGVGTAYRWHEQGLVSASTCEGLNDAVLEADLEAGRIDGATYKRRRREIHRVSPIDRSEA